MDRIEIYENLETGEFTVSGPGFDDYSTFDEVAAEEEAEAMRLIKIEERRLTGISNTTCHKSDLAVELGPVAPGRNAVRR